MLARQVGSGEGSRKERGVKGAWNQGRDTTADAY
jgi:hypothetical protein